jgi:hypothetical protein
MISYVSQVFVFWLCFFYPDPGANRIWKKCSLYPGLDQILRREEKTIFFVNCSCCAKSYGISKLFNFDSLRGKTRVCVCDSLIDLYIFPPSRGLKIVSFILSS